MPPAGPPALSLLMVTWGARRLGGSGQGTPRATVSEVLVSNQHPQLLRDLPSRPIRHCHHANNEPQRRQGRGVTTPRRFIR